jgi:hypothetical protein
MFLPTQTKNPALGRVSVGFATESVVSVSVFVLVLMTAAGMRAAVVVVVAQVTADCTTCRATEACANGGAGRTTEAVTDDRTTRRAQSAANGRLCATALFRANRTTGCAADTRANRSAGTASDLSADDVTQRTTQPATDGGGAVTGRHGQWCEQ